MAAKTYPQQVAELKSDKEALTGQVARLQEQIEASEELREKIALLEDELKKAQALSNQGVGTQAQWNDLTQRAESAETSLRDANNKFIAAREYAANLESQLDLLGKEQFKVKDMEAKVALLTNELQAANYRYASREQQVKDFSSEKEAIIDSQSRELQTLRMKVASQDRILYEVRAALSNAPDVIASLKYIVGINGSSAE